MKKNGCFFIYTNRILKGVFTMKMNAARGYPQVFHVIPHEKAYLADEAINRVRAKGKYLRASLAREVSSS
jgi:hypothetical protein